MTLKEQVVRAWCCITGTPSRYNLQSLDQYTCLLDVRGALVDGEPQFRARESYRYDRKLIPLFEVLGTRENGLHGIQAASSQLPNYVTLEEGDVHKTEEGLFARYRFRIGGIPAVLLITKRVSKGLLSGAENHPYVKTHPYSDELATQFPPTSIRSIARVEGELFSALPIPSKKVEAFIEDLGYQLALLQPRDRMSSECCVLELAGLSSPQRNNFRKDLNAPFAAQALYPK